MVIKIKTDKLKKQFKKISMEGEQAITECLVCFEKDGMKIYVTDNAKQVVVSSILKLSAFESYATEEELCNVGLNDLGNFVKVLDRFGEFVTIKIEGNLMTLNGDGKKVDIELVDEKFLNTQIKEPELEFTDTFITTAAKLKDIFQDVTMNKDATLTLETTEKQVTFSNTGKYKFVNVINAPTCKGGAKATFGQPLINATKALDAELEISMGTDYPMKVMEKTEDSIITYIVAPRVGDE